MLATETLASTAEAISLDEFVKVLGETAGASTVELFENVTDDDNGAPFVGFDSSVSAFDSSFSAFGSAR